MSLTIASEVESWTPFHALIQSEYRNKAECGSSGNFPCEARPMLGLPGYDHRQGYHLFLGGRIG